MKRTHVFAKRWRKRKHADFLGPWTGFEQKSTGTRHWKRLNEGWENLRASEKHKNRNW